MHPLITYLRQYIALPDHAAQLVLDHTQPLHLLAGESFAEAGQVAQCIGFLAEGVVRVFSYDDTGDEVTMYFLDEGHFVVDLDSFTNQKPALSHIQAVTDCSFVTINRAALNELSNKIPGWDEAIRRITEEALLEKVRLRSPLVATNATMRYRNFLRDLPAIARRVPLQYVASYLGIAPQSLSRIRRQKF